MDKETPSPYIVETNIKSITHLSTGTKIPIESYTRTWTDRNGKPYKYEFRGNEYQGYHNPDELFLEITNA